VCQKETNRFLSFDYLCRKIAFVASAHNESDYYGAGEVLSSSSASSVEDSSAQLLDEGSLLFSEMNRFVHDDNGTLFISNDVNVVATRPKGRDDS
jgi:hypothetical protein